MPPFPARFYPIPSCLVLLAWANLPASLLCLAAAWKIKKIKYDKENSTSREKYL
jgi:hypothetical protein